MVALFMILFIAFGLCVLAQFWFMKRLKDVLIDRHPRKFLEIERAAWTPGGGIWKLTRGREYRALNDPVLNTAVRNMRLILLVMLGAWILFIVAMPMFVDEQPRSSARGDRPTAAAAP